MANDGSFTKEGKILIDRYMKMTPKSQISYKRSCNSIPNGNTRRALFFKPYPVYISRGEGCKIYDIDGNEYIDYTNNLGPIILGHSHPSVIEAIENQIKRGTVLGGPTELEIDLAEEILNAFPHGEQVLFCASGTEANMLGLRAVPTRTAMRAVGA